MGWSIRPVPSPVQRLTRAGAKCYGLPASSVRGESAMPLFSFEGKAPRAPPTAFVAPTATLIGDVVVEERASVWYGAVLRGAFNPIVVRAGANVQDNAVLHTPPAAGVEIGPGATVGHLCLIHAAGVGEEALIGNCATVLDGAKIGARAMSGAGAVGRPGPGVAVRG